MLLSGIVAAAFALPQVAWANEIDTNMAQMQAMDKITGKVSVINVPVNGSVDFGSFSILVRACKTRPPEDMPENFAFVDVVDNYNSKIPVNIFRGWMISSSPALNPVEHPIYDVWLLKCIDGQVNPSALLSKEELAARDALPKASALADNTKLKEEVDTSDKSQEAPNQSLEANASLTLETASADKAEDLPTDTLIETELQNQSISNPPAVEAEDIVSEPIIQEEGAPKSLLNIGNTSVAQTEAEATEVSVAPSKDEKINEVQDLVLPAASTSLSQEKTSKEDEKDSFLGNFLSLGKTEENSDDNKDSAAIPTSAIDSEIDKELMQLQ